MTKKIKEVKMTIKNCHECPHHSVEADPDPHDWFCDDDVKVVCKLANKNITCACRPYNVEKESSGIPKWCPLAPTEPKTEGSLCEKAKQYAIKSHNETNHLYDGKPYSCHLEMVVENVRAFSHPHFQTQDLDLILSAAWLHDVIEDARQTYNDVKNATSEQVAEIVYALTTEKGKTRKDRANDKYYTGIKGCWGATFIKLCDRLANSQYSKERGSSMFEKYKREYPDFKKHLYVAEDDVCAALWNTLDEIYGFNLNSN